MMARRKSSADWLEFAFLGLAAFSILGTAADVYFGFKAPAIALIASIALILVGSAAAIGLYDSRSRWSAFFMIALTGFMSESVGLYTGLVFGSYQYTDKWQPVLTMNGGKLFPILLPLAWWIVVGSSYALWANKIHCWMLPTLTGLTAVAADLVLEQANLRFLHYWTWNPTQTYPGTIFGVPAANFGGWFLVSSGAVWGMNRYVKVEKAAMLRAARLLGYFVVLMATFAMFGSLRRG